MSYVGILPSNIRRNKNLSSNAKVVYAEITATMNDDMCCERTNHDIGESLGLSDSVVSSCVSELSNRGYIDAQVSGSSRKIYLSEKVVFVEEKLAEKESFKSEEAKELADYIVKLWKSKLGTKTRVTPKLITWVKSRLKSFSKEEIIDAVLNRYLFVKDSEWHNKPENIHHKTSLALVLRDDQVLQQSLDRAPRQKEVLVTKLNIN